MKKMVCELCSSTEFVKSDGFFECLSCHTKYSEEEAKKLIIEVKNQRFEEKLAKADALAKGYFSSSSPDTIVYKSEKGIKGVMKCYNEAKEEDDSDPDYYLHAVDFYIKATINRVKKGKGILDFERSQFEHECKQFFDKAKEYAKKKEYSNENLNEIDRKRDEAERLINEELKGTTAKKIVKLTFLITISMIGFLVLGLTIAHFADSGNKYYVSKLPKYNAATVMVDGYIHKSKTCCKKVADKFGAEVIEVDLKDVAGYTEYGQAVTYEKAFKRCPYCYN